MPYTPPSPSPNASYVSSRANSRSASFSEASSPPSNVSLAPSKPQPTRSTSYLNKHRRSQGGLRNGEEKTHLMSPPGIISSGPILHPPRSNSSTSIRQLPSMSVMPTGVVISPPDSSQNSSDDEADAIIKRGRSLVNMAELEEAIRNSIPQRREASPIPEPKSDEVLVEQKSPEMLSARIHQKISHVRSASDVTGSRDLVIDIQPRRRLSQESSPDIEEMDDDDDDDEYRTAPPMVRKKSGELVKPSLKSPGLRRRPSSMPSTPTYPKVVHFDAHLEHVRHFLHSERPTAVSAGSSPVESAVEFDTEYPFPNEEFREPSFEWEIVLPNFPERIDRSSWIVRVEKVVLSHDKKALLGTVAVANIHYQKLVVARFTLDYWQTTSEVVAEFTNDVRRKQQEDGYDRFTFKIKLEDMANLENKILFFCVRYRVADQEFWDNNSAINYQVDFKKKAVPQNGKVGPSSLASRSLPRSKPSTSAGPRPRSMPIFDDSFDAYDIQNQPDYKMFSAAADRQMQMRPIIRPPKKVSNLADPEVLARRANPSGNAFGNRYDFGASLAAAMDTATKVLGSNVSGIKQKPANGVAKSVPNPYFQNITSSGLPRSHSSPSLTVNFTPKPSPGVPRVKIEAAPSNDLKPSLEALKKLGAEGKPSIESTSYRELLDNYCFFGSAKPSPQLASGSSMPSEEDSQSAGNVSNKNLTVSNIRNPGSRSPSPSSISQSVDDTDRAASFLRSPPNSQKNSRSSSPSHSAFGYSNGLSFDVLHTPSVIQT